MLKLKVTSITPVRHQATGDVFLDVDFDFIQEDRDEKSGEVTETVVANRKLGFAPTISQEELAAELDKALATYNLEQEQKVVQQELDAIDENVAMLQKELVGVEIEHGTEPVERRVKKQK